MSVDIVYSPLQNNISNRQKILENKHNVSDIEKRISNAIKFLGIKIITQMMIYNPYNPQNHYSIDIYLPDYDMAIEVDGSSHFIDRFDTVENVKLAKQLYLKKRRDKVIKETGIGIIKHIDVSLPRKPIYRECKNIYECSLIDQKFAYHDFFKERIFMGRVWLQLLKEFNINKKNISNITASKNSINDFLQASKNNELTTGQVLDYYNGAILEALLLICKVGNNINFSSLKTSPILESIEILESFLNLKN